MDNPIPYVLGLDLGTSSLGWAVIDIDDNEEAIAIRKAGVRIFDAGVDGDIEQGKDSSRAVVRRQARQPRRQQWRRQQRKKTLFVLLQSLGLLPASDAAEPADRKSLLDQLDSELAVKHLTTGDHEAYQKLAYQLRDQAVSGPVEPFELGRALYHLAQRRGYQSNRKTQGDDDERTGIVTTDINELQAKLDENGDVLGTYFSRRQNPIQNRIRRRYTAREMYQTEFRRIRETQAGQHGLTNADWDRLFKAIFFQRPLKSQKHLIGKCDLEPIGKKWKLPRCPQALPIAQEFRLLQKVNDLNVYVSGRATPELTTKERNKLIDKLRTEPSLTWSKVKTLLKIHKTARFSLEEWDDRIMGHQTNAKMLNVFGPRWFEFSEEQQDAIVLDVLHYRNPVKLQERAIKVWGLDAEAAVKLSKTKLEETFTSHSKRALIKLVHGKPDEDPKIVGLIDGAHYSTVKQQLYPESFKAGKVHEKLQPVNEWKRDIRNPAVIRALTELRKVINTLIEEYGKPYRIHIELARDLRNSRKKRKDIHSKNEDNRKRREKAVETILAECGIDNPNRRQVEKWLLADECNRECPYCGDTINMQSLMGDHAEFNIEHIYPRRFLDDSYLNKTIACRTCNDIKGDRTPAAAFAGIKLEGILQRVSRFQGPAAHIKLERFKTEVPPEGFVERQMNDTRYNSRLAATYLGTLYGGHSDAAGKQRILTPTGALTGKVRANWQLNDLLSETHEKTRDDHRHHAVDAIVVALMDQRCTQLLAESARDSEKRHSRHFFGAIKYPWGGFKNAVAYAIEDINVSHRPTHTIAGPLHAESIYSKPHAVGNNNGNSKARKQAEFRIRKQLHKLTAKEIQGDQIVDPVVRKAVQDKYRELGGGPPAKLFTDFANHPALKTKDGRDIPIHKVRLRSDAKPRSIGKGARQRNVASGKDSNYASMVYAIVDKDGNETRWVHEIITRLEAHEFLSANHGTAGEKVLIPQEAETRKFKFSLRKNDMLEADGPNGDRVLYRVQKLSQGEIQLCPHNQLSIQGKARNRWNQIQSIDNLRKYRIQKVNITLSGRVRQLQQL